MSLLHIVAKRMSADEESPAMKPSDLPQTTHYHWNRKGEIAYIV